jgi:hypothetical protein
MNNMSGWLRKFVDSLKKQAIDKLPEDELNSGLPPVPEEGAPVDPSMMGMDPSMMGMDPSMMPMPEPKPKMWNNKYLVNLNGPEFIVELTPSIVMDPATDPTALPPAQTSPMADTTLNPNADPDLLQQWMKESDDNDKPYQHNEQGTVDPLSKEDEGIEDTGNEQSVKVHNKKALLKQAEDNQAGQNETPVPITPGADRSNAYPPCKYCANFNAAENSCSQGLDVEKVQAAKSCSWLNSTMSPFNGQKDPDSAHKDQDTVVSDVNDLPNRGGQGMNSMANLKTNLNDIWD